MQGKNKLFRLTWVVVLSFNVIWVFTKVSLLLLFTFSQEVLHLYHEVQTSKGNFRHTNAHIHPCAISLTHSLSHTHIKHTDVDINTHTSLLFVFIEDLISRSLSVCGLIPLLGVWLQVAPYDLWVKMWESRQRGKESAPAAGQMGVLPLFQILQ